MTTTLEYTQGSSLPDSRLDLEDAQGVLATDLADATLSLTVGDLAGVRFTKTTGLEYLTGTLIITWAAGEVDQLPAGLYRVKVTATAPDSRRREFHAELLILGSGIA